jgi:hypothetical protein
LILHPFDIVKNQDQRIAAFGSSYRRGVLNGRP